MEPTDAKIAQMRKITKFHILRKRHFFSKGAFWVDFSHFWINFAFWVKTTQKGIIKPFRNKPLSHLPPKFHFERQNDKNAEICLKCTFWAKLIKLLHFCGISIFLHFGRPDAQNTQNLVVYWYFWGPETPKCNFYRFFANSHSFCGIPQKSKNPSFS